MPNAVCQLTLEDDVNRNKYTSSADSMFLCLEFSLSRHDQLFDIFNMSSVSVVGHYVWCSVQLVTGHPSNSDPRYLNNYWLDFHEQYSAYSRSPVDALHPFCATTRTNVPLLHITLLNEWRPTNSFLCTSVLPQSYCEQLFIYKSTLHF